MIEPTLADIDLFKIILIIIFFVGPLLGQLGKAKPKAKAKGPQRPQPPVGPLPPRKALDDEIADFLRQAQQNQPKPAQQPLAQQPAQERLRPIQPDVVDRPRRGMPGKPKRPPQPLKKPPVKPAAAAPLRKPLRENVAEHVTSHIDTSSIRQHSDGLGGRLRNSDEQVEQHLHDVFDHQLGDLDSSGGAYTIREGTDDATWEDLGQKRQREQAQRVLQANDIMRMMRDPVAIQEAIVLGELLRPPISERS